MQSSHGPPRCWLDEQGHTGNGAQDLVTELTVKRTSDGQVEELRARLAGKRLLGFDTSTWARSPGDRDAGRTVFAMVGGKDQRVPAQPRPAPFR